MSSSVSQPLNAIPTSLNLDTLKSIQSKLSCLKPDLQQNESIVEYQQLLQLFNQLNTTSSDFYHYFASSSAKTFFLSQFMPEVANRIMKYRYIDNHQMMEILIDCLKQIIHLEIKMLSQEDPNMSQIILDQILDLGIACCRLYSLSRFSVTPLSQQTASTKGNVDHKIKTIGSSFFENFAQEVFDKKMLGYIYETLCEKTCQPSLKMFTFICSIVGNLSYILPQDFAMEYALKIREAINEKLKKDSEVYAESFTNKNIKETLRAFKLLFKRSSTSPQEFHRAFDTLKLQITILCLGSRFIEHSFIGLKILDDVITEFQNPRSSPLKILSEPVCQEFLSEIFRKVHENDFIRRRVIKASLKLLTYLLKNNLLETKGFKLLWKSLKELNQIDKILFKIIVDEVLNYVSSFQEFLKSSLSYDINAIDFRNLEVLESVYREFSKHEIVVPELIFFYWKLLINSDDNIYERQILVLDRYIKLCAISKLFGPVKIIGNWIDYLKQNPLKFAIFRILMLHTLRIKDPTTSESIQQISEKINFLNDLLRNQLPSEPFLTYDFLLDFWDAFVAKAYTSNERDIFLKTMTKIVKADLFIESGHFEKFFREKLASQDARSYLGSNMGGVNFLKSCFIIMNESLGNIWRTRNRIEIIVRVLPEKLEGFDIIWSVLMSCKRPDTTEEIINFLISLYLNLEEKFESELASIRESYLTKCFHYLQEKSANCSNLLRLIDCMIDESGRHGIGALTTHNQILKSEFIRLEIDFVNLGKRDRVEIQINSNKTVFELLKEAAKLLEVNWNKIALYKYSRPELIHFSQNGRTLQEIGLKNHQRLTAYPREIQKIDLLLGDNVLIPNAEKIFSQVFEEYSDNDLMNPEQWTAFRNPFNWRAPDMDPELKSTFLQFDSDKDGYLTRKDFLNSCIQLYKTLPHIIWQILDKYKIRGDLKNEAYTGMNRKIIESGLVSYIISKNNQQFRVLFDLLDSEDKVALEAWKVVCRLPTDSDLLTNILTLEGVRGKYILGERILNERIWNNLLNLHSKYKLLYTLNIVEYLACNSEYNNIEGVTSYLSKELQIEMENWLINFVHLGGLAHLNGIFSLFRPQVNTVAGEHYKRVLWFVRSMRIKLESLNSDLEGHCTADIQEFIRLSKLYERNFIAMAKMRQIFANRVIGYYEELKVLAVDKTAELLLELCEI